MMKIKNLISSLALAAVLLVIAAGSAEAQNPFASYCDEGATLDSVSIPFDDSDCGDPMTVYFCYNCPTDNGQQDFKIKVTGIKYNSPYVPGCDGHAEIIDFFSQWSFIQQLCPSWSTVPPCNQNPQNVKSVELEMPLCWKFYRDTNGDLTRKPCQPTVDCYCVYEFVYCYDNGAIRKIYNGVNVVNSSDPAEPCPTQAEDPGSTCDIYQWDQVTIPTVPGTSSDCFNYCY